MSISTVLGLDPISNPRGDSDVPVRRETRHFVTISQQRRDPDPSGRDSHRREGPPFVIWLLSLIGAQTQAAVHEEDLPGHVACIVTGQKGYHPGDLFRLAD